MQTGSTARGNPRSFLKKKEKLKVLIVKSTVWRIISPAFLASGLVRTVASQAPVSQGDEFVWMYEPFRGLAESLGL